MKFEILGFLIQVSVVLSLEKVLRVFVPDRVVKEFNLFTLDHSGIDTWLSLRLVSTSLNMTLPGFKYFTELRVKNDSILKELELFGVKYEIIIDDLEGHVSRKVRRSPKGRSIVGKYVSYNEVSGWMIETAKKYPNLVRLVKIGRTFENRPIMGMRITTNPKSKEMKPLFLFDGGIHAREWLSVATVVYMIDKIIKQYNEKNGNVTRILKNFELHFVPVLNPDGYEYSRASKYNRYWRKNMRHSKGADHTCYGVDLNRNFDHKWMVSGASANPCSEVYAGRYPASESEIKSLQDYIMNKSPRWVSHISLHSYGAIWLSPFSYSKLHLQDNYEHTCQKALTAIRRIEKDHGFSFRFGSAAYELYEASGCSEDWSKDVAKVNHTFVVELKPDISDPPEAGFEHPESQLVPASQEVYDGFIEYIMTFFKHDIDKQVINECKQRYLELVESIENLKQNS